MEPLMSRIIAFLTLSRPTLLPRTRFVNPAQRVCRSSSSTKPSLTSHEEISTYLSQPTWSVRSAFLENKDTKTTSDPSLSPEITHETLHHLLRLSALPVPQDEKEEQNMLDALRRQLHFVRALRESHSSSPSAQGGSEEVEPLVAIRDETLAALKERTIGLDDPDVRKALFEGGEEVVGKRGRIVSLWPKEGKHDEEQVEWDPVQRAGRKLGRFIVVDTKKD